MDSKIPRFMFTKGTRKTDDQKLEDLSKAAKPKPTEGKTSLLIKADKNIENTKEKFKNEKKPSQRIMSKTGNKLSKQNEANNQKKEKIEKNCFSENTRKQVPDKDDKSRKTNAKSKITNKLDTSPGYAGISLVPKNSGSSKPIFDLNKNLRRSKTETNLKIGKPSENGNDIINDEIVNKLKTNKSKTINQRDLKFSDVLSPEFTELDAVRRELAHNELVTARRDAAHGGIRFIPKSKKRNFNFNFNVKSNQFPNDNVSD